MSQSDTQPCLTPFLAEEPAIAQLARECSLELNVHDVQQLEASQALLPEGKRLYVSFLPKQTWQQTLDACREARHAGFDPVPHVPVRLLESERALDDFLASAVRDADVREVLLIAGDYAQAIGPYSTVPEVLQTGRLTAHGLRRVSVAGHPEGHPKVSREAMRRVERQKCNLASQASLEITFVTQFFFEAQPFIDWSRELREGGVQARLVAGLAGPASVARLFRLAIRCGVGPSIRALGARPTSVAQLMGDHGPAVVMRQLARARCESPNRFDGVHLFCFGGFLRTCEWVKRVAAGELHLNDRGGFDL